MTIRSKTTGQFLTVKGNWRNAVTAKEYLERIDELESLACTVENLLPSIARRHKLDLNDLEPVPDIPRHFSHFHTNPF